MAEHFLREGIPVAIVGPKDVNLLHSALSRQFVSLGRKYKWTDKYAIVGTLFYGLVKNHAFHDGNKRTALLVALYHLWKLGYCPKVKQREFEKVTLAVADNKLPQYSAYKQFAKRSDPEVRFLAKFFRRSTRQLDKRFYSVTYHQLNFLLKKFDYCLANPKNNHIDIIRLETKREPGFPFRRKWITIECRVGQIGFPGWKSQVGKGAINTVRKVTGLTSEKGYDSQVFYQGLDPIENLISAFYRPLKRLARK
jgi:death-on-curing protein